MARKWKFIILLGVLFLIILPLSSLLILRTVWQRAQAKFSENISSAMLGVHYGETVPATGRVINKLGHGTRTFNLPIPIVLYPGAHIQGVCVLNTLNPYSSKDGQYRTAATIIMATNDPAEKVLDYYSSAWEEFHPKRMKPMPSVLYDSGATDSRYWRVRGIATSRQSNVVATVTAETGPELRVMNDAEFRAFLEGDLKIDSIKLKNHTATEIWLDVPLEGTQ